MLHKWSGEGRDEQFAVFLKWMGILVTFVLVGLVVVVAQRTISGAQQKIQGTYQAQGGVTDTPDTPLNNFPTASSHSGYPGDYRAANAAYASSAQYSGFAPASSVAAPVLPVSVTASSPFAVDAQRREAALSLRPVRQLMQTMREFDSKALNAIFTASAGSGPASPVIYNGESETGDRNALAEMSARQQQQKQAIERMINMSDGLAADISLTAHPDNFAPPLQEGMGEVSRELRIYLATIQLAAAHPERREELRSLANQHLAASEQALQTLESMTGSGLGSLAN